MGVDGLEFCWILEEFFDFVEFFDGFVCVGDVGEGDCWSFFVDEFGFGFVELYDFVVVVLYG